MSFIKHVGQNCPVDLDTLVRYRVTKSDGSPSHIHHPVKAAMVNWGYATKSRIYDYEITN